MAWFRRAEEPEAVGRPRDDDPIESTDTVGNPIVERRRGRHVADAPAEQPSALPTRAEHRMLQLVAEGRVARSATGASEFWRLDGAFATGTKAMMLDWLLEQQYVELGPRTRVVRPALLTAGGLEVLQLPS